MVVEATQQQSGKKSSKKSSSKSRHHRKSHQQQQHQPESYYDQPRHAVEVKRSTSHQDDHLYDVVRPIDEGSAYQNISDNRAVYQNMDDMYDRPVRTSGGSSAGGGAVLVQSHYQNLSFQVGDDVVNEDDDDQHTYLNISTYAVPRSEATSIYDHPRNNNCSEYDYPKGLIPLSARLLLNASRKHHCDTDSLPENDSSDEGGLTELRSGSSPDEGIGTELDPKGLCAIAEEEEACYSNVLVVQQPKKSRANKAISTETSTDKPAKTASSKSRRNNNNKPTGEPSAVASMDEKTPQTDRCIEVYHETLRQRNSHRMMKAKIRELVSVQSAKEDVDNASTIRRMKKLLPSVRALRTQFEPKNGATDDTSLKTASSNKDSAVPRKWKSTSNFQTIIKDPTAASSKTAMLLERSNNRSRSNSLGSLTDDMSSSASTSSGKASNSAMQQPAALAERLDYSVSTVSILQQLPDKDSKEYDMYRPRHSTAQWDPTALLEDLYKIQPLPADENSDGKDGKNEVIDIEGALDKLPSGRRKATFWNAWKRRYFQVKDGNIYCYQNSQSEKPSIVLQLGGGQLEVDNNMISIDDGKGHYMVVRGSNKAEADRWYQALISHVNNYTGGKQTQTYVQPRAIEPKLLKDVIVLDLGSSSIRAGILSAYASLPQVFLPSVAAVDKGNGQLVAFGLQATLPEIRANSSLTYPLRPNKKISKHMLDMDGVTGLIRTALRQLNVDPSTYGIQVSLPRHLNHATQAELTRLLFDEFGVQSVNLTHQSVLSLLSYNSTSGIVVDIGERIDIVPIMDGYMLESGASQVPYGGQQLVDHLRHFLVQQRCSLITEVESYLIRHILEKLAYVAGPDPGAYAAELSKAKSEPSAVRGTVDLRPFSNGQLPWDNVSLELGRFQVTEGLFHPEAWGLDNPGVQKLVHKAIQDCSVDIRKEMVRSIYLSGGVTLLPNFPERLESELDRLTPSHLVPKVHAHPYRYHSSFIGACVLSNSPAYEQSKIRRDEWLKGGPETVRKWKP